MKGFSRIEPLPSALLLFVTGILLAGILPQKPLLYFVPALISLSAGLLSACRPSAPDRNTPACFLFLFLPFLCAGIIHAQFFRQTPAGDISNFAALKSPALIEGTVINQPPERNGAALVRVEKMVEPISIQPVTGNLLLIFRGSPPPVYYGDRLRVRTTIERTQPGETGFDYASYLNRQRIWAIGRPEPIAVAVIGAGKTNPVLRLSFRLRRQVREILEKQTPEEEPEISIMEMMSFGINRPKPELKEDFQRVGIYHLLVVSGLHVGFFLIFLHFLLSPFGFHPKIKALLCLPAIATFVLLCGLTAPVLRAALMAGFYYLGIICSRDSKPANALFFAAFCTLLFNPLTCLEAGWQLTYLITLGLIVGGTRLSPLFQKLPGFLAAGLPAALVGQLASIPLTAFHFGNIPILGILANLIFVPFSSLIVLQTFLTVAAGPAGLVFGNAALFLTGIFYRSVRLLAEIPFTALTVPKGHYWYFLLCLPLVAGLMLCKPAKTSGDAPRDRA